MSVSSAILSFNYGKRGLFEVFTNCGLEVWSYAETFCYLKDASNVRRGNVKSSKSVKKRRKTLRSVKMGFVDKDAEEEPIYASGTYNWAIFIIKTAILISTYPKNRLMAKLCVCMCLCVCL